MTGNVTTENNDELIQIRLAIKPFIASENFLDVYINVYGNNKKYSIRLRTPFTIALWQYYNAKFQT